MTSEDRVRDLAARIVDRRPIEWDSETGENEEMSTQIRNLRMLERIRALHLDDPPGSDQAARAEATPTRPIVGGEPPRRESPGVFPGAQWGTLELEELVGAGSYGEVWRAWDQSLHTHVALKLLHPRGQRTEEILREARQMAKVRHENVVQVHGAAVHGGRVGIWYSFIVGKTLERQLEEQGAMGPAEAAVVSIDLLRATAAVHAAGLVHRDIKTSNVMREDGGRIILMDFGTVVDREAMESLSATDAFTGTAPYMAPEIFGGQRPSVRSDIYALGVVLYRLVTDRYPRARVPGGGRPTRPGETTPLRDARPDLPAPFVRIVERAMAEDPTSRYASAGEMERDLSGFLAGQSGQVAPARPAMFRRRDLRAALAAAIAAVAVWLVWHQVGGAALEVEAAVFREATGGEERLRPGGRVRPGDQLFLELKSSRDAYVYVLTEDLQGNAYLLFPLRGTEPGNPIRRGAKVRLPGVRDGDEQRWDVETAGGEEALYVIASTNPLRDLESEMRTLPEAGSGAAGPLPPESVRRGISGLSPAPAPGAGAGVAPLSGIFGELSAAAEKKRDLWTWSIRLENPLESP